MSVLASPSPLDPAGSEAHRLAGLWWLLFGMAVVVAAIVITFIVLALFRGRRRGEADPSPTTDRRFLVGGGIVMPILVLTVVAVATVHTTVDLRRASNDAEVVEVTAEQWFWRVHYVAEGVDTANDIRLPVDRPVEIRLRSHDVVHSFWVPRLAGKLDVLPEQTNTLRFTPNEVGSFRGECAEFCGLQHANMNFVVDVMPVERFDAWVRAHQGPPPAPATALEAEGRRDFQNLACAGCHTIKGVSDGTLGPDLTDIGGRPTLGSGTVDNTEANLTVWMNDARQLKPGVKMPPIQLTADEVTALVAYLRSLR